MCVHVYESKITDTEKGTRFLIKCILVSFFDFFSMYKFHLMLKTLPKIYTFAVLTTVESHWVVLHWNSNMGNFFGNVHGEEGTKKKIQLNKSA